MDFNDIYQRLQRVYFSINERFDYDFHKYGTIEEQENENYCSIVINSSPDKVLLINKVMLILYNMASLKDHFKKQLTIKKLDQKLIENEIENSLHLQVLIDIVNKDKHGDPLTKQERSKKNPRIANVFSVLNISGVFLKVLYPTLPKVSPSMDIKGTIVDGNGIELFSLDELIEVCFAKWNEITFKYKILEN